MTVLSDPTPAEDLPLELTIPLPDSASCSEKDHEEEQFSLEAIQSLPPSREMEGLALEDSLPEEDKSPSFTKEPSVAGAQTASLDDLALLGTLERDYISRANILRKRLDHLQYVFGLGRRLVRVCALEYRSMAGSFETGDQPRFLDTYEANQRLSDRITILHRAGGPGILDPDPHESLGLVSGSSSWIEFLPLAHQKNVLRFLTRMRSKSDYLADRLSKLSSTALLSLTSAYQSNSVYDSVLPGQHPLKSQGYGKSLGRANQSSQAANPSDLGQTDPIFVLLYGIFDDSFGPGSRESWRRTEVWSTACARLMATGQRGSDEFVNTALNTFANLELRPSRPKLESYLAKVLKNGSFLLNQPPEPATDFKESVESRNAKAAIAASTFFEDSITELLRFLAEDPPSVVNRSLRDLVRSILGKLDKPKIRDRAETFILSKWFFGTYITDILTHPESHGVLMAHHIGNTTRRTILKDLAHRLQRQIFDITSPWKSSLVSSENQALIQRIFESFRPSTSTAKNLPEAASSKTDESTERVGLLTLSPRDLMHLIRTMHPQPTTSPASEANVDSGNISTSSSVADSSTLTSGSTGFGSRVPSSAAPSISGTSMTSTTVLSEDPLRDMGTTGYENIDNNKRSTIDEIRPGRAEEDHDLVSSLHEALRIIESMIENDPDPDLISKRNWSQVRISKDGGTLSTNFATNDEELQDPWLNDDPQGSLDDNDHDLADLYEAVSKAMENHNRLQSLQHQLHEFVVGEHPMYICYHSLLLLLEGAQEACESSLEFAQGHFWWRAQQMLRDLWTKDQPEELLDRLIRRLVEKKRDTIDTHVKSTKNYEVQAFSLERSAARYKDTLAIMEEQRKRLRLKMWYICDVKNSAAYADALQVTRALRAMTEVGRSRQASGITSWARQRLRTSLSTDKAAAQAVETLAAPKDYGGPTRLADQQAELTTRWLTKNSVENFCKGEERLHRFCHEVQKCANKLAGSSIQESPVLWSSNLFRHEKAILDQHRNSAPPRPLGDRNGRHNSWSGRIAQTPSSLISSTSALGPCNDLSLYTPRPLNDFWKGPKPSPVTLEYGLRPSLLSSNNPSSWLSMDARSSSASNPVATAVHHTQSISFLHSPDLADTSDTLKSFACGIKQTVTSLLLSDLGYILWNNGSETDLWINDADLNPTIDNPASPRNVQPQLGVRAPGTSPSPARGDALSDSTITIHGYHEGENRSVEAPQSLKDEGVMSEVQPRARPRASKLSDKCRPFRFSDAFSNILQRFSSSSDPYKKLDLLSELEMLVLTSLNDVRRIRKSAKTSEPTSQTDLPRASPLVNSVGAGGASKPRTKATSLEEVIANCTERRAATLTFTTPKTPARDLAPLSTVFPSTEEQHIGTDEIVSTLLDIFRDDLLRPSTLYRDLQLIAAHIPSSILDQTAKGKAFWDAGLAALALKEERISAIITRATRITTYHISATKETDSNTFASSYSADLVDTTLSHAAQLWTIAAKEGSPVAARELALFYLTHPHLVARVTMPLSRVKEVFKTVTSQERGVDTGGLNPLTFAVVFHWMEVAANGGDKDARDFLRGTGDLSATR